MDARIQPYGERSYLLCDLKESALRLLQVAVERDPPSDLQEYVSGYETFLLVFKRPVGARILEKWVRGVRSSLRSGDRSIRKIEVPVCYDGADLKAVAKATGLSERAVVDIHRGGDYRVRMMGFAPGFPYLDGLDRRLHLDRKTSPRKRIEPGSVAIGGTHAGIYSVASPGGWHLLGRTDLELFSPKNARQDPWDVRSVFALSPGDRVKFVEV